MKVGQRARGRRVQLGSVHWPVGSEGVLTRSLAHRELQILEDRHAIARNAYWSSVAASHDGDPCTRDIQYLDTDAAQFRGR